MSLGQSSVKDTVAFAAQTFFIVTPNGGAIGSQVNAHAELLAHCGSTNAADDSDQYDTRGGRDRCNAV